MAGLVHGCSNQPLIFIPNPTSDRGLNSRVEDNNPALSYDGRYAVFSSDRDSVTNIYLQDLQTNKQIPLPGLNYPQSAQYDPDISADGRYIVYVSEELGSPNIFLYDRPNMTSKNLTVDLLAEVRNPSISGNSRFVSFEVNRSGQWDLAILDLNGETDPAIVAPATTESAE
jgi:Tol biopolymer transport system component